MDINKFPDHLGFRKLAINEPIMKGDYCLHYACTTPGTYMQNTESYCKPTTLLDLLKLNPQYKDYWYYRKIVALPGNPNYSQVLTLP